MKYGSGRKARRRSSRRYPPRSIPSPPPYVPHAEYMASCYPKPSAFLLIWHLVGGAVAVFWLLTRHSAWWGIYQRT